jgi:hypothetical protein
MTTPTLRTLSEIEQSIQTHLKSLIELGYDLRAIRDGAFAEMTEARPGTKLHPGTKLYNECLTQVLRYSTPEEYWFKRWHFTQRYVNQLIRSAEVAEDLVSSGAVFLDELKESVISPLGPIPRQDRAEVFENAQEAAKKEGHKLLKDHVQKAVNGYRAANPGKCRQRTNGKAHAKQSKQPRLNLWQRTNLGLDKIGGNTPFKGLTKKEVDPNFTGNAFDFATKYGHVSLETAVDRSQRQERQMISAWIGALRDLKRPLQAFLTIGALTKEQLESWITKLGPEKTDSRRAEVQEVLDLIRQTNDSIDLS